MAFQSSYCACCVIYLSALPPNATDKRIAISGDIPRRPVNSSPNTEVKPFSADGIAWAAVWESRTPPKFFQNRNRAAVPVFLWRARIAEFALS
jgi:hypothetical protein